MTSCAQSHLGDSRSPCEQIMRLCALRRLDINIRQILDIITITFGMKSYSILNTKKINVRLLEKKTLFIEAWFKAHDFGNQ